MSLDPKMETWINVVLLETYRVLVGKTASFNHFVSSLCRNKHFSFSQLSLVFILTHPLGLCIEADSGGALCGED